jgi:hypothetical protein
MCDRPASKLLIFWGPGQREVASTFVRLRPVALVSRSFERFALERLVDRKSAAKLLTPR